VEALIQGLWSAASGMEVGARQVDALAVDMANVNTVGFKSVQVPPVALPPRAPAGVPGLEAGVGAGAPVRDWTDGAVEFTGRPWDLAIQGPGLFPVRLADGTTAYTRAGAFHVDGSGNVVDRFGHFLLDGSGQPVVVPQGAVGTRVTPDGQVLAEMADGSTRPVATLSLFWPQSPDGLQPGPDGTWVAGASAGSVAAVSGGRIVPGALETANVDVASAMVGLVLAQRAYQLNAQALQTADQMWAEVNRLRG
jgi:flagellar basal body rod protein FlgG